MSERFVASDAAPGIASALAFRPLFSGEALRSGVADKRSRLLLIDCGRAVAALAVLFCHYRNLFWQVHNNRLPYDFIKHLPLHGIFALFYDEGSYAVPIFWIISGFVFSRVYIGHYTTTKDFLVNRFARLYPLHLLTLVSVVLLQSLSYLELGTRIDFGRSDVSHFLLQLGFASNWFTHDFSFNFPIWSVSIEVLIYAVFWALHRRLASFGILLPLVVSLAFYLVARRDGGNWIAQCGFNFFVGVTLDFVHRISRPRSLALRLVAVGMVIVGLSLLFVGAPRPLLAIPAIFGGALIILVELDGYIPAGCGPLLNAIGDNTYGMYLWHIPIILSFFVIFGSKLDGAAKSPWFLLVFLTTVIAVARISFVAFEKPMRMRIRRWTASRGLGTKLEIAAP